MGYKTIGIQITPEHFDRSIKGSPKDAIKELIWNACDADAKNIEVSFSLGGLTGEEVTDIYVKDDGHGIPYDYVSEYFGKYGSSQKSVSDTSPSGRVYHGKLGQGRYKCLAVATYANWETTYSDEKGNLLQYEIKINSNAQMDVEYSDAATPSISNCTGTLVHLQGINDDKINSVNKLNDNLIMVPELLSTFAPYLLAYSDITLIYNGRKIDPSSYIEYQEEREYSFEEKEKQPVFARALFIQWKQTLESKEYICGNSGVVYDEKTYTPLQRGKLSLYLLSERFETMHRENTLILGPADPAYAFFDNEAKKHVKALLQKMENDDAIAEIGRIKNEGAYPYLDEPKDEVDKAEQSVFDVLAVEVNRVVPQLKTAPIPAKKLTYRLMREAINTNPSSIKTILTEVFNLSQEQQDDLAELLTHTHLPEIMDVAKTVGDRLTFIDILEQMVYNDSIGKAIKERTQFHKMLLNELWVFGEKYSILTSDKSLKTLLKEHIKCLGREELIPVIPPEAAEDLSRIPDICLFNQVCLGYEQYEHLVIELKRPRLVLTKKEVDQIEDYALTVSSSPLFDKATTKWKFILLGQDYDSYVMERLKNITQGTGNLYNSVDGSVSISVLRWNSVIQDNKFKYEFLKRQLNYKLRDEPNYAMDYLMKKYGELFPNSQNEVQ